MTKNEISVKDLAALFGGEIYGNDTLRINGFKSLVDGSKHSASFFTKDSLNNDVNKCKSTLLIVSPLLLGLDTLLKKRNTQEYATLVHKNPKLVFARCSNIGK